MKYIKEYKYFEDINWEEDWEEEDPNDTYKDYPEVFKNFLIEHDALEKFHENLKNSKTCIGFTKFWNNIETYFKDIEIKDWMIHSFHWSSSPQEDDYWNNIYKLWYRTVREHYLIENKEIDFDFEEDWEEEEPVDLIGDIRNHNFDKFGDFVIKVYKNNWNNFVDFARKNKIPWITGGQLYYDDAILDGADKFLYIYIGRLSRYSGSGFFITYDLGDDDVIENHLFENVEEIDFIEDWEEEEPKSFDDLKPGDILYGRDTFKMVGGKIMVYKDNPYKISNMGPDSVVGPGYYIMFTEVSPRGNHNFNELQLKKYFKLEI